MSIPKARVSSNGLCEHLALQKNVIDVKEIPEAMFSI
jgi:hypothetical protein